MPAKTQPIDRRLYFRHLARDTVVWFEELLGKPQVELADLPKLPAETLALLIPQICPGTEILPEATRVCARLSGAAETVALFSSREESLLVFNRFNGRESLGSIADELSAAMNWPRERAFAYATGLFFRLVALRVCVPSNDLPAGTEE